MTMDQVSSLPALRVSPWGGVEGVGAASLGSAEARKALVSVSSPVKWVEWWAGSDSMCSLRPCALQQAVFARAANLLGTVLELLSLL